MAAECTGNAPFVYKGESFSTWYKVVGDLKSSARPLVVIHGGPGISHHYLLPHVDLVTSHSIPLVFYDQIGIGSSSHVSGKPKEFWTVELFMDELDNLLGHLGIGSDFDILGHSWGAMMGAHYAAARNTTGLKGLILVSGAASMELWSKGTNTLLQSLPKNLRETLETHEKEGTTDSKEYQDGMQVFYSKYVCTVSPWPEDLLKSFHAMDADPTVYATMIGPSEFHITGTLSTWTVVDILQNITIPTLVTNGASDEAQDVGVEPFFWRIPKVKWVQFGSSSHMAFYEERERYMKIISDFLKNL